MTKTKHHMSTIYTTNYQTTDRLDYNAEN